MRTVTLFMGAGLADAGLSAAGCEHVRGIEWDKDAAEASRRNGLPCVTGDVRDLSLLDGVGEIDLVWSSFPCQAFSTAGKREGAKGDRNGFPWTVDVLDHIRPKWLIAENVRGLTMHVGDCPTRGDHEQDDPEACPKCYLDGVIVPQLEQRFAWVEWRVLDSADYGVPQRRRRVYVVAGPRPIEWPKRTHSGEALAKAKWVTGDYWRGIVGEADVVCGSGLKGSTATVDEPAYTLRDGNGAAGLYLERAVGVCMGRTTDDDPKHPVKVDEPSATLLDAHCSQYAVATTTKTEPSAQEQRWLDELKQPGLFRSERPAFGLKPWVTVRQALGLGGTVQAATTVECAENRGERPSPTDEPCPTVSGKGNQYVSVLGGGRNPGGPGATDRNITDEPSTTIAAQSGGGAGNAGPFVVGLLDKPSPCVSAVGEHKGSGANANPHKMQRASDALFLATGRRRLTVEECMRLMAAPDGWQLHGTKSARYRQAGNGVTPPVAEALARAVMALPPLG